MRRCQIWWHQIYIKHSNWWSPRIEISYSIRLACQNNFWMVKNRNRMVYTRFTCWIISGWIKILFQLVKPWLGCCLTRLTPQMMSEPFRINCQCQKSELNDIYSFLCQIGSGWTWILFESAKPRIGCYLSRLTCQIMSEPLGIIL